MDVNISTRAVGYLVVMPARRPGRVGEREREGKKSQHGGGLHRGERSGLVVLIKRGEAFNKRVTGQKTRLLRR